MRTRTVVKTDIEIGRQVGKINADVSVRARRGELEIIFVRCRADLSGDIGIGRDRFSRADGIVGFPDVGAAAGCLRGERSDRRIRTTYATADRLNLILVGRIGGESGE